MTEEPAEQPEQLAEDEDRHLWSFPIGGKTAAVTRLTGSADRGPVLIGRVGPMKGLTGRAGKGRMLQGRFAPDSAITVRTLFTKD